MSSPTITTESISRFALCNDFTNPCFVQVAPQGAEVSSCTLIDALAPDDEIAIVEFWSKDDKGWFKHQAYHRSFAEDYPLTLKAKGRIWHIISGTINSATRGEVIASTNPDLMKGFARNWSDLDGVAKLKLTSRVMQPSQSGNFFAINMLVVDDAEHDGDAFVSPLCLNELQRAFNSEGQVLKLTGSNIKVVFHEANPKWDLLPEGCKMKGGRLYHHGEEIDGVIYRANFKLANYNGNPIKPGSIVRISNWDLRLHSTDQRNNYRRAGLGRQVLQYVGPELGAGLLASSDMLENSKQWCAGLSGDIAAVKSILRLDAEDGSEDHESRDQLTRHINAGASDLTIPYLRSKLLPVMEGFYANHLRKGKASGGMIFTAPSDLLKGNEIVVPRRMLTQEERAHLRSGGSIEWLAARYPVTSPSSINRMRVVGMHFGAVCYVANPIWRDAFQGDHDGDQICLYRVDASTWRNSTPWQAPATPTATPVRLSIALERAAESKRLVAIGETLLAEYHFRNQGNICHDVMNELGTRLVCAAVDMAKHGYVDWALTPELFSQMYLGDDARKRHPLLALAGKSDGRNAEGSLKNRLALLKASVSETPSNGWELLLSFIAGQAPAALLPLGDTAELHARLSKAPLSPNPKVAKLATHARRRWAAVCRAWITSKNDACLKAFSEGFEAWLAKQDDELQSQLFTAIGRTILDPSRQGTASLWFRFVPDRALPTAYPSSATV